MVKKKRAKKNGNKNCLVPVKTAQGKVKRVVEKLPRRVYRRVVVVVHHEVMVALVGSTVVPSLRPAGMFQLKIVGDRWVKVRREIEKKTMI